MSEVGWYHDAYEPIPSEPMDWSRRPQSCVHCVSNRISSQFRFEVEGGGTSETHVDGDELEHSVLRQNADDRLLARLVVSVDER